MESFRLPPFVAWMEPGLPNFHCTQTQSCRPAQGLTVPSQRLFQLDGLLGTAEVQPLWLRRTGQHTGRLEALRNVRAPVVQLLLA